MKRSHETLKMDESGLVNLTKQQKRDIRRSSLSPRATSQSVNSGISESQAISQSVNSGISESQPVKLTKQQKRDLRRKGKTALSPMLQQPPQRPANSSVYKRETVYPNPCVGFTYPTDRFVTPKDGVYEKVLNTSYSGFVIDTPKKYSDDFHDTFRSSLLSLNQKGYFQYDYTQPFGLNTKIAKTYVTRCLVGEAGITYKYLGLRMFSYPWNKREVGCTTELAQIKELNDQMILRTQQLLSSSEKTQVGSCHYNLTLINKCFKDGDIELKLEPTFNSEAMAVSWHADSSLEHFSSIGIYHFLMDKLVRQNEKPWRIALRVMNSAEGPTSQKLKASNNSGSVGSTCSVTAPPIAVELPDRHTYYLLDDFNHHHHHAVLSGSTERYASTHRVSRTDGHTYLSIRNKCIQSLQIGYGASPKQIRSIQMVRNELEFEWIRQFYIQGRLHFELHLWWKLPMQELVDYWNKLEEVSEFQFKILKDASNMQTFRDTPPSDKKSKKRYNRALEVTSESYDSYLELVSDCDEKRLGWCEREKSLMHLPIEHRPHNVPMKCDLKAQARLIEEIRTLKSDFQANLQM